jgi:MFS family permease
LFSAVFFFASPAASAAYLTVGESFPLETRAMAIAIFYALGTAVGGVAGPMVFGHLIGAGGRLPLFHGYLFAAALMIGAALVELAIGIKSERQSLESVAAPLASVASEG